MDLSFAHIVEKMVSNSIGESSFNIDPDLAWCWHRGIVTLDLGKGERSLRGRSRRFKRSRVRSVVKMFW
jgi:hypothetical protein